MGGLCLHSITSNMHDQLCHPLRCSTVASYYTVELTSIFASALGCVSFHDLVQKPLVSAHEKYKVPTVKVELASVFTWGRGSTGRFV